LDFYLVGRVASARVVLFFLARKKKQLTTSLLQWREERETLA
jgi:hypothetical protein